MYFLPLEFSPTGDTNHGLKRALLRFLLQVPCREEMLVSPQRWLSLWCVGLAVESEVRSSLSAAWGSALNQWCSQFNCNHFVRTWNGKWFFLVLPYIKLSAFEVFLIVCYSFETFNYLGWTFIYTHIACK